MNVNLYDKKMTIKTRYDVRDLGFPRVQNLAREGEPKLDLKVESPDWKRSRMRLYIAKIKHYT